MKNKYSPFIYLKVETFTNYNTNEPSFERILRVRLVTYIVYTHIEVSTSLFKRCSKNVIKIHFSINVTTIQSMKSDIKTRYYHGSYHTRAEAILCYIHFCSNCITLGLIFFFALLKYHLPSSK